MKRGGSLLLAVLIALWPCRAYGEEIDRMRELFTEACALEQTQLQSFISLSQGEKEYYIAISTLRDTESLEADLMVSLTGEDGQIHDLDMPGLLLVNGQTAYLCADVIWNALAEDEAWAEAPVLAEALSLPTEGWYMADISPLFALSPEALWPEGLRLEDYFSVETAPGAYTVSFTQEEVISLLAGLEEATAGADPFRLLAEEWEFLLSDLVEAALTGAARAEGEAILPEAGEVYEVLSEAGQEELLAFLKGLLARQDPQGEGQPDAETEGQEDTETKEQRDAQPEEPPLSEQLRDLVKEGCRIEGIFRIGKDAVAQTYALELELTLILPEEELPVLLHHVTSLEPLTEEWEMEVPDEAGQLTDVIADLSEAVCRLLTEEEE